MKNLNIRFITIFLLLLTLWYPTLSFAEDQQKKNELNCTTGPTQRNYAQTDWLVYSCDDGHSLLFVTAPGSPAFPFYFVVFIANGIYQIVGEGTGDKAITDLVYKELGALSKEDILSMIKETKDTKLNNP